MADKLKLYCLLDGETPSRAMPIRVDSTDSGGDLKELLRAKKTPRFDDIAADELILWQVSIPVTDDEDDSPVFLGDLKEKKKVFPTKLLSDLFGEPPKDTIHVIVQKPSSVRTLSSIIMLKVTLKTKSRRELSWTTDVSTATLDELHTAIFSNHPDLFDDGVKITIRHPKSLNHPASVPVAIASDAQLRNILVIYNERNLDHLTIELDTPSKSFSSFSWTEVNDIYGKNRLLDYDVFPNTVLHTDEQRLALDRLHADLKLYSSVIGRPQNEAEASTYIACFLGHSVGLYNDSLQLRMQNDIKGRRGNGPVDFSFEAIHKDKFILGVVEAKFTNWRQGLAQNVVQLESALTERWRSPDRILGDAVDMVSYGIITTGSEWYFAQCTLSPSASDISSKSASSTLTEAVSSSTFHYTPSALLFSYNGANWKEEAEIIFTRILWVIEAMLSEIPKREKRHRIK